jgi:hypothetical protein
MKNGSAVVCIFSCLLLIAPADTALGDGRCESLIGSRGASPKGIYYRADGGGWRLLSIWTSTAGEKFVAAKRALEFVVFVDAVDQRSGVIIMKSGLRNTRFNNKRVALERPRYSAAENCDIADEWPGGEQSVSQRSYHVYHEAEQNLDNAKDQRKIVSFHVTYKSKKAGTCIRSDDTSGSPSNLSQFSFDKSRTVAGRKWKTPLLSTAEAYVGENFQLRRVQMRKYWTDKAGNACVSFGLKGREVSGGGLFVRFNDLEAWKAGKKAPEAEFNMKD